jgi:tripartite ATP-independent transporter DctP family solute receptor
MKPSILNVLVAATFSLSAPIAVAETTIKLGHVTQISHPFHIGAKMYQEEVRSRSDGDLNIKIYPARQLGDDKQLLEGVRLGTVDAAIVSSAVFAGFTPVMDALQLPFLINTYDDLSEALTSSVAKDMLDSLETIGLKGLGYYEGGLRNLLVSEKPVTDLDGMKGLKIRVVPAPLHLDIWKAIGASPTPMAYGEIYTSLQTGVLDGAEINISSVYSEKLYEVSNYIARSKHYFWPGVMVINPRFFEQLSKEQQDILIKAAHDTIAPQIAKAEEQEARAEKALLKEGMTILEIEDRGELRQAVQPVIEKYLDKHTLIQAFVKQVESQ